jgi:hypothetical protein
MNALYTDPLSEALMDPQVWQSAMQIDAHNAINACMPQIVMDSHGNALAVWTQTDGQRTSTWTNRFVAGQGWDTATPLAIDHGRPTDAPHIAMNAQGSAIAVWIQDDGIGSSVWARRYSIATGWGRAELLETEQAQNPKIAINANGMAIAMWQQAKGTHCSLCYSSYAPVSDWSQNELILISHHGPASRLQMAIHPSGNAVAVWYQFDGEFYRIWAKHYKADAGWCATQKLTDNAGDAFSPQVCLRADGSVVAAWYQDDGICNSIWSSECTAASTRWSAPQLVNQHNGGNALDPQIATDAQGCTHAVWSQFNGEHDLIWANRHVPEAGWGRPELIQTDSTGTGGHPQIAVDASGRAYAMWVQSDGQRDHLVASHYTSHLGWAKPQRLEIHHTGDALLAQLAVNTSGNAMAVWQQYDGMANTILAASYGPKNYCARVTKK